MIARAAMLAGALAVGAAVAVAVAAPGGGGTDRPAGPPARPLAESVCSPVAYGGKGRPTALIALSTLFQGTFASHGIQGAQAVKLVLAEHNWRAGDETVGLQACDEKMFGAGASDPRKCGLVARAVAANPRVLGVVGPWSSLCGPSMLPVLNRGAGGPVATLSPSATYLGFTRRGPGVGPGDPARYHPSGTRSFARVVPADDAQAAAGVQFARRLGVRRVFVLRDEGVYGLGLAGSVRHAAASLGMEIAGERRWRRRDGGYAALVRRIGRTGADAVYLAGAATNDGPRLIADLRAGLGPEPIIIAADGFAAPDFLVEGAGVRAEGVTYTIATLPNRTLPARGRRFAAEFERRFGAAPCCFAVQAAQATEILLEAIAGSDGTREDVTRRLKAVRVEDGLLGSFRFDAAGDMTRNPIAVYRIRGGRGRFEAALEPSAALLARD